MSKSPSTSRGGSGDFAGFRTRLRALAAEAGSQLKLAEKADVSPAWLSKLLKDGEPTLSTLIRLAQAGQVSVQWLATGQAIPLVGDLGGGVPYDDGRLAPAIAPGFADAQEALPLPAGSDPEFARFMTRFADQGVTDAWRLRTNALDLAGYLPDDVVIVASGIQPRSGADVVVAQTEADDPADVRTIWRIYAPPVLMPASTDRRLQPISLDQVAVVGVVVGQFRWRQS